MSEDLILNNHTDGERSSITPDAKDDLSQRIRFHSSAGNLLIAIVMSKVKVRTIDIQIMSNILVLLPIASNFAKTVVKIVAMTHIQTMVLSG